MPCSMLLPLGGAAALCEADEQVERALILAASHLGMLFQIQDDIVDTLSDGHDTDTSQDVSRGRSNLLIVHCLQSAGSADVAWLKLLLERSASHTAPPLAEIALAKALIERTGSLDFALGELLFHRAAAMSVRELEGHPALLEIVETVCELMLERVRRLLPGRFRL